MSDKLKLIDLNDKIIALTAEISHVKSLLEKVSESVEVIRQKVLSPKRTAEFRKLKSEQTRNYHADIKKYKEFYEKHQLGQAPVAYQATPNYQPNPIKYSF